MSTDSKSFKTGSTLSPRSSSGWDTPLPLPHWSQRVSLQTADLGFALVQAYGEPGGAGGERWGEVQVRGVRGAGRLLGVIGMKNLGSR